ncbi:TetR/AcrR family transcriptional regulator [Spirochaeta dissipatitropha]
MKRNTIGKQAFIDAVLELLDQGISLRELNLRAVARHLGCAHTNAYNWFSSQEDLYWHCLGAALDRLTAPFELRTTAEIPGPLEDGSLFDVYVRFFTQHPAWFRLIWEERLEGPPPASVQPSLGKPRPIMAAWLDQYRKPDVTDEALEEAGRILHAYLQGELSAMAAGRTDLSLPENRPEAIIQRARTLYSLLSGNQTV